MSLYTKYFHMVNFYKKIDSNLGQNISDENLLFETCMISIYLCGVDKTLFL